MADYVNYCETACSIVPSLSSVNVLYDMRQRQKSDFKRGGDDVAVSNEYRNNTIRPAFIEYPKFVFYCMLLVVPLYAIAKSVMNHDWFMMAVDMLLLPVGFVHGILLLFGFVE